MMPVHPADAADRLPRLLAYLPDMEGGGAQRTMINLVNTLPAHGFDVTLCTARGDGPARAWLKNTQFVDFNVRRARWAALPLAGLIRRRRPDIVFSTMGNANISAALASRLAGGGHALVLRETNSIAARSDLGRGFLGLLRWAYRRADRVVALSRGVGDELASLMGLPRSSIVHIPNPVAVADIAARVPAGSDPWPPRSGRSRLLAIGRLVEQKGFDLLLAALARLPADIRPDLTILGHGRDRMALLEQARALGLEERLHLAGFVADTVPWMAHADLFVLSSRWEGFGHVIVEAMGAGLPVVAFDCPHGPRDIIEHDRTGLLVPAGDVPALSDALHGLLRDPDRRRAYGAAALQAAQAYESDAVTGRYATLFRELLRSGR